MPRLMFRRHGKTDYPKDPARSDRVNDLLRSLTPEGRDQAKKLGESLLDALSYGRLQIIHAQTARHCETAEIIRRELTHCLQGGWNTTSTRLYIPDGSDGKKMEELYNGGDAPSTLRGSLEALHAEFRYFGNLGADFIIEQMNFSNIDGPWEILVIGSTILNEAIGAVVLERLLAQNDPNNDPELVARVESSIEHLMDNQSGPCGGFDIDLDTLEVTIVELD